MRRSHPWRTFFSGVAREPYPPPPASSFGVGVDDATRTSKKLEVFRKLAASFFPIWAHANNNVLSKGARDAFGHIGGAPIPHALELTYLRRDAVPNRTRARAHRSRAPAPLTNPHEQPAFRLF